MPSIVSSLRSPRPARAAVAALLALGGLHAAHAGCLSFVEAPHLPPKSSEAAVFYIPPSEPSQTKAFSSDCSPVAWSGTVAGPGSTGSAFVGWAYSGAAQASPAAAHVAATSQRVGSGDAGAAGSVGVTARSVLPFTLQPLTAAAAGNLFSLQFDVIGEGEYGGSSVAGNLGSASVHLHASGGVGFTEVVDELYSDSNGWVHKGASGSIGGPSALVQLSISYLAGFAAGANAFQIDLDTLVSGQAFSDFSHTAKITGITLLSDDVELLLPDGYFVKDGARHWSLLGDGSGGGGNDPDPVTVPEPGTAALALAAGLIGGCRRRRWPKPAAA
jgi:hypothetical protein